MISLNRPGSWKPRKARLSDLQARPGASQARATAELGTRGVPPGLWDFAGHDQHGHREAATPGKGSVRKSKLLGGCRTSKKRSASKSPRLRRKPQKRNQLTSGSPISAATRLPTRPGQDNQQVSPA